MSDDKKNLTGIEAHIAATVVQQERDDAVGKLAAAAPLPGPTKQAFSVVPDIKVGTYSVRRFCDGDFLFLSNPLVAHPLMGLSVDKLMKLGQVEIDKLFDSTVAGVSPSGPQAWALYWILTRPWKESQAALKDGTIMDKAAEEFAGLQYVSLAKLFEAAMKQFTEYFSTTVEYGTPSEAKEGEEEAEGQRPPPSSVAPSTGSAG